MTSFTSICNTNQLLAISDLLWFAYTNFIQTILEMVLTALDLTSSLTRSSNSIGAYSSTICLHWKKEEKS